MSQPLAHARPSSESLASVSFAGRGQRLAFFQILHNANHQSVFARGSTNEWRLVHSITKPKPKPLLETGLL